MVWGGGGGFEMLFAKPCRSIVLKIDQSSHDHVFVVFLSLHNFLISNITSLKKKKKIQKTKAHRQHTKEQKKTVKTIKIRKNNYLTNLSKN